MTKDLFFSALSAIRCKEIGIQAVLTYCRKPEVIRLLLVSS